MSEVPVLRSYRSGDLDALFAIDTECSPAEFRFSKDSLNQFIEERGALTLVAENVADLAGFIIVQLQRTRVGSAAYVVTLDVRDAHRRTGLGSRLMLEGERLACAEGAEWMRLHVFVENTAARSFYVGLGYEPRDLAVDFYGAALDGLVME